MPLAGIARLSTSLTCRTPKAKKKPDLPEERSGFRILLSRRRHNRAWAASKKALRPKSAPELVAEADRAEAEAALQAGRGGRGRSGSSRGFRGSRRSDVSRGSASAARGGATASRGDRATALDGAAALDRATAGIAAATVTTVVVAVMTPTRAPAAINRTAASGGPAAIATIPAAAIAAIAAMAGHDLVFTAQEGDADHREENRDAKHQCSIHPKFLQQNRYRTVRD